MPSKKLTVERSPVTTPTPIEERPPFDSSRTIAILSKEGNGRLIWWNLPPNRPSQATGQRTEPLSFCEGGTNVMEPTVIRIPKWSSRVLGLIPGWHESRLTGDSAIARHAHSFLAVYFAFGVRFLQTTTGQRGLPIASMVIVPAGALHGWKGTTNSDGATVGHFHRGHPAHAIIQPNAKGA